MNNGCSECHGTDSGCWKCDGSGEGPDPAIAEVARIDLRRDKQPVKCERCGGGPGEPGCGKIVHAIMDDAYARAEQSINGPKEAQ